MSVDETLARWAQRDAAIGLDAELAEVRLALEGRDSEIADLRQRNEQLAQRVAQLVTERDGLSRQVAALQRPPLSHRVYRRARSFAGRALRAARR
jgi:hypothetical protein